MPKAFFWKSTHNIIQLAYMAGHVPDLYTVAKQPKNEHAPRWQFRHANLGIQPRDWHTCISLMHMFGRMPIRAVRMCIVLYDWGE